MRHALSIKEIIEYNPQSLLLKFMQEEEDLNASYLSTSQCLYLNLIERSLLEVEMKERRKQREAQKYKYKKISHAIERTATRIEQHPTEDYEVMSVRALAAQFPEKLGLGILHKPEFTQTNKTIFMNKDTGWYVCYDNLGDYNTVHNNLNHYVALNGDTDPNGKAAKYHFRNNENSVSSKNILAQ